MSLDFLLLNICDHKFVQEISILGSSPNYYSDLEFSCNPNISTVHIFDANVASAEEIFSMQGEGISNFYLDSSGKRIIFGRYPVTDTMNFPNPHPNHIPSDKYFCSYIVRTIDCPKCNGKNIVSDIEIDAAGRIATITGTNKLRQQILKALMTLQGSNLYDISYGSITNSIVGTKIDAYAAASLQFSILDCLNKLMEIQKENNLPSNETISSISDISAEIDKFDPRKININITVFTMSYEEVTTSLYMNM